MISPLLLSCWGFSFALRHGYLFLVGSNIFLLMVVQQRVVILEFSQEKMSAHPSTLPFPLLNSMKQYEKAKDMTLKDELSKSVSALECNEVSSNEL